MQSTLRRCYSQAASKPRVVFSGIQPTGIPHLGNYLGALKNWVSIQNSAQSHDQIFYSVVGLHAITVPQNPSVLRKERKDILAALLAVGLDPKRCTIFHQDQVPQHAELAWILNCMTSVGRLQRMTTWKSRLATLRNANSTEEVDESLLQLGLLAYPVLQAADVLLYNTNEVPVGEDQEQHIELTRDIARTFNRNYKSSIFTIPDWVSTPQGRVASLRNPLQKMSKSHPDPKTRILLTDTPDQISSKIKSAVTDSTSHISYEPESRPGVANLLSIWAGLDEQSRSPEELASVCSDAAQLKERLKEVLIEHLDPIRNEFERLSADQGYLAQVEKEGARQAEETAAKTLARVKTVMGLQ